MQKNRNFFLKTTNDNKNQWINEITEITSYHEISSEPIFWEFPVRNFWLLQEMLEFVRRNLTANTNEHRCSLFTCSCSFIPDSNDHWKIFAGFSTLNPSRPIRESYHRIKGTIVSNFLGIKKDEVIFFTDDGTLKIRWDESTCCIKTCIGGNVAIVHEQSWIGFWGCCVWGFVNWIWISGFRF